MYLTRQSWDAQSSGADLRSVKSPVPLCPYGIDDTYSPGTSAYIRIEHLILTQWSYDVHLPNVMDLADELPAAVQGAYRDQFCRVKPD